MGELNRKAGARGGGTRLIKAARAQSGGRGAAFVAQALLHRPTRPRHQGPRGGGTPSLPSFREKQQHSKVLPGIGGRPAFSAEGPWERARLCRPWGPLSAGVTVRQRGHPSRERSPGTPALAGPAPPPSGTRTQIHQAAWAQVQHSLPQPPAPQSKHQVAQQRNDCCYFL